MNTKCEACGRLFAIASAATLCALNACFPSEYEIEVRLTYPDGRAVVNTEITALPFDRDALRDSIAANSQIPRPDFSELENELAGYERPDLSGLEETFEPWQAIYDSVHHLADSLISIESNSTNGYSSAYARLRGQYQRLAQSSSQRDAALREHVGYDRDLAMRAAAAADSLRAWEGVALASFPEIVDSVLDRGDRPIHQAMTWEDGTVQFTLAPGRWWLVARTDDTDNPFMEIYWNVGVRVHLIGSKAISLHERNGARRWRY